MRYSANLNIIIKAIEKASSLMSRDFMELENLQSNPATANKFATACYNRVKQVLSDDFLKFRPEYNQIFPDGKNIIRSEKAEYSFTIFPVDGFENLCRANPYFTVAVALEHINESGERESISVAINKIFGNETYYCERGFGSYLNNRRIRVSKRSSGEVLLAAAEDQKLLLDKMSGKKVSTRSYGSRTLELAYLASARLEMAMFKNHDYELLKPFMLLVREAGGKISEEEKSILASN